MTSTFDMDSFQNKKLTSVTSEFWIEKIKITTIKKMAIMDLKFILIRLNGLQFLKLVNFYLVFP